MPTFIISSSQILVQCIIVCVQNNNTADVAFLLLLRPTFTKKQQRQFIIETRFIQEKKDVKHLVWKTLILLLKVSLLKSSSFVYSVQSLRTAQDTNHSTKCHFFNVRRILHYKEAFENVYLTLEPKNTLKMLLEIAIKVFLIFF